MTRKKRADPYDVKLDPYEQEIEDALDFKKLKRPKNAKAMIAKLQEAAVNFRRDKQINIRISSSDLIGLKQAAAHEGMPYQTLIASILHKYVAGHIIRRE